MSFDGEYSDPNHPGCKRTIVTDGSNATLSGTDTPGGDIWTVSGTVDGNTITVDFSPKGGPKGLKGTKIPEGIKWEDGNIWPSVSFPGEYSDPNHPGCKRTVNVHDGGATISGTDEPIPANESPEGKVWSVSGTVAGDTIVVDFSPKGGPKGLKGQKVTEGIKWEDGNMWHSIP
eukprot:CAMPEP_0116129152 /NCGR_PEP_ID=MMETSP0329-20121206/7776_1 /TAXON_ID=697910 /ORGANISM="Pseudo-nitzschia arenysensis, Strain B593" /LENGTH=173 /DNA_ID=CAMNT_0003623409 /DNA_START=331 /DNA_END=852 /DNA_ORIENTATION=+